MTTSSIAFFALLMVGGDPPVKPYETEKHQAPKSALDEAVFKKLEDLGIRPSNPCSDEVFLRRVYLDITGTLPSIKAAKAFLEDKRPIKRSALIDRLLEREGYADYWAMKWGDLLRVKAEFPINLWPNAAQAYHHWIRTSLHENKPYDRFVRELLTSNGSNFRVAPVNFYRALQSKEPKALAGAVALAFMGSRTDTWKKDRLGGITVFFSCVGFKGTREWKEEIVYFDAVKAAKDAAEGKLGETTLPDGSRVRLDGDRDPREVFADWLISPKNAWFARSLVNRVWSWLLGRGIIHEPDDLRPDNPASNRELLELLEKEFVSSGYDLKKLFRTILNSRTYQLSCIPATKRPDAAKYFAVYPIRRLEAEVLVDALCKITGTSESYSSMVPEPFTFIPENLRSIELPDGSISSPFLDMFGRPPRDTGLESERSNKPTASQRLHLLNSSHIQQKIEQGSKLRLLLSSEKGDPRKTVKKVYLAILSRYPTEDELRILVKHTSKGKKSLQRNNAIDLVWALFNSTEFLYRH